MPDIAILLPPSETKSIGGDGPPLRLDGLAFDDELGAVRKQLLDAISSLTGPGAFAALGISERQTDQLALNAAVWDSPTVPALHRYTGVLYDALDYPSLPAAARRRADVRVFVASALFGLVRAGDRVPAYRLSAGSSLPGLPGLPALWRPALVPVLAGFDGLVLDLRSGAYAGFAPAPGAVTVRVLTELPDGTRKVVSHFNKHHKGVVGRTLLTSRASVGDVAGLLRVLRRSGMAAELAGPAQVDVIVR